MEKQRNKSIAKSFERLLIALLIFTVQPLYSQTLTSAIIRELRIVPAKDQILCVNSEIKFEVTIPYTMPGQLELLMPEETENVSFKTLRKVESEGGTKIEIWFLFAKTGTYQLKPLVVKIKNSRRQLNFEPVTIGINPKEQQPLCVILSGNERNKNITVTAGQKIKFRVCLQYAIQLVRFSWDIPKDSLFVQGKLYDFAEIKQREKIITDELIPVCDFEWTPLVPGRMDFPTFYITAVSYNGDKVDVALPKLYVNVLKANSVNRDVEADYFGSAFESDYTAGNNQSDAQLLTENPKVLAEKLAALRLKERKSLSLKARRQRMEYEEQLGLPSAQKEFRLIWVYLSVIFVASLTVVLIILIRKKRNGLSIVCGAALVCAVILLIYCSVLGGRKYGITTGTQILSIPEASATVKSDIPGGNRVQILSSSGNWYFIRFGETEGWCLKNGIILI